mmetsp:Transcript_37675/g.45507  ORF Transcript_37675/g.45507 Transcript_37675/m.45507 type:complete len:98 (+) Transcript_37675:248-541(+)
MAEKRADVDRSDKRCLRHDQRNRLTVILIIIDIVCASVILYSFFSLPSFGAGVGEDAKDTIPRVSSNYSIKNATSDDCNERVCEYQLTIVSFQHILW